jgi:hypothetical protein
VGHCRPADEHDRDCMPDQLGYSQQRAFQPSTEPCDVHRCADEGDTSPVRGHAPSYRPDADFQEQVIGECISIRGVCDWKGVSIAGRPAIAALEPAELVEYRTRGIRFVFTRAHSHQSAAVDEHQTLLRLDWKHSSPSLLSPVRPLPSQMCFFA